MEWAATRSACRACSAEPPRRGGIVVALARPPWLTRLIYGSGRTDFLGWDQALAFEHAIESVGVEIFERFDLARRPANFDGINFAGHVQAEVHAQIAL